LKLSHEYNPARGNPVPPELQVYYDRMKQQKGSGVDGRVIAGTLWAEHYRQSPQFQKYVMERQRSLQAGAHGAQAQAMQPLRPPRPAKDSMIRQTMVLARRQFDLIRYDWRTLLILLLMMPLIGGLFAAVSAKNDLTGKVDANGNKLTIAQIDKELSDKLKGKPAGEKIDYIPTVAAETLITMIGLALTQGGTFAAAYEIVKERAIFKRERAVNLNVLSYVLSKALVYSIFAVIQVASVLLVLSLVISLKIKGALFENGLIEMYITLYLAIVGSIMFGLFISAVVPSPDVVLYAILGQLFVQIVLAGTFIPINENIASKATISYWTMNSLGSTVDLVHMNDESRACSVIEVEVASSTSTATSKELRTACDQAKRELSLKYQHTAQHVRATWIGLLMNAIVWFVLTVVVQARKKID
jgi:hypothetical protein